LRREPDPEVLIVGAGTMAQVALEAAAKLAAENVRTTVVDPRWIKPLDPALIELAAEHRLVVTIEDNGRTGGLGAAMTCAISEAGVSTPVQVHAVDQEFLDHAKRAVILQRQGLTGPAIASATLHRLTRNTTGR